jgi:hypothetical protein
MTRRYNVAGIKAPCPMFSVSAIASSWLPSISSAHAFSRHWSSEAKYAVVECGRVDEEGRVEEMALSMATRSWAGLD